jgi:thioredoxin-related protein
MKKFAVMMLVAGSLVAQSVKEKVEPHKAKAVAGPVQWETDPAKAMARAKAEHKLIFCDLWTEWCGWCIKLQKDTFPSAEAQEALGKVVALSVKTELRNSTPTEFKYMEARYQVEGYPTLLILDAEGKEVARHAGYFPPKEFKAWVNGVVAERKSK